MGIADLTGLLKKSAPNCFVDTPAYNLNNRRIAFDGFNWIFTVMGISVKNVINDMKDPFSDISIELVFVEVLKFFLNMNTKLLNYKITPVWIWDSDTYSTPAKTETRQKRREDRKKRTEKFKNLQNTLRNMNVLERPTELIKEYQKLRADTFYFPKEKLSELKDICQRIGLPSITAEGEGEYLAACMAIERIVACVYSGDTDTIAIGAPFVTKKIDYRDGDLYISGVFTPSILKALDLNYHQFRDLCFLLGCDFNKRIKGIGPVKALDLMKKYGNIEDVLKYLKGIGKNTDEININTCRELLTPSPSGYIDKLDQLNVKTKEYDTDLEKYNIEKTFSLFFSRSRLMKDSENVPKND
jgi:flap endonuclease-1